MRSLILPTLFLIPVSLTAQTATLQFGATYECPAVQASMKIFSCTGAVANDMCDVQTDSAKGSMRGKSTRQQVMGLLTICHAQTAAEAKAPHPAVAAANPAQTGAGGFKIGDDIQVQTAGGYMHAKVLQVRGNSYFVRADNGGEVWKSYPAEIRRIGKLTMEDHRNGQYELHDKVQVNVQGQWLEGEISGYFNTDFDIRLPDGRTAHANLQNIRPSTAPPPAVRPSNQPPKAGLASCAGKFEGRYAPASGGGGLTIVFRSGKATTSGMVLTAAEDFECWTGGGKILLYKTGASSEEIALDINNDGTLEAPLFGELKKKGN